MAISAPLDTLCKYEQGTSSAVNRSKGRKSTRADRNCLETNWCNALNYCHRYLDGKILATENWLWEHLLQPVLKFVSGSTRYIVLPFKMDPE